MMIHIMTVLAAIFGFVAFIYLGDFILMVLTPNQGYEDGITFTLVMAVIGAILGGILARRIFLKRSQK